MSADAIRSHPTQDDARAALEALTPELIEHVVTPAFAYLQDRLAEYEEGPLWGRDTAMVTATIALAIHAHTKRTKAEIDQARDIIGGLESLVSRVSKSSVSELPPDLGYKIKCLYGCDECGKHPDTHCTHCEWCPCECEEA